MVIRPLNKKQKPRPGSFKNSEMSKTKGSGLPQVPPDFPQAQISVAVKYSEDLGGQRKPPTIELQSLGASLS